MACLDVTAFLGFLPEFGSHGSTSAGAIEWLSTGTAGDSITIGPVTLTAVAGARAAGSLTWSVDGTAEQEAASFAAALADSAAKSVVTASRSGAKVSLTTVGKGPASLLTLTASDSNVYSVTSFAGGDDQVRITLAAVCTMIGECWGSKAGMAHAYLTAHFLEVAAGNEQGIATGRSMNSISHSLTAPSFDASDAAFASTRYGRLYLALRQSVVVLPMTTAGFGFSTGCRCG